MRKRIPGFAPAVSMIACQAVSAGIGSAAATLKSSEGGFFTRSFTGTSAYSAKLPKTSPKTSSPSRNDVLEPGPIFSMTPAKSCPSVSGTRSAPFGLYWCSRTIQSTGLTPAARIRTSALPRVTFGVATSSSWTRSEPPNLWMRTAFMGLLQVGAGMCQSGPVCASRLAGGHALAALPALGPSGRLASRAASGSLQERGKVGDLLDLLVGREPELVHRLLAAVDPERRQTEVGGTRDVPGVRGDEAGRLRSGLEPLRCQLVHARARLVDLDLVHADDPRQELVDAGALRRRLQHARCPVGEDGQLVAGGLE